jgi:AP-3 complex subunit beta
MTDWAPDLLRKCARSFVNEAPLVKMQIVTLAGKLIIIAPPPPPSPSASPPPEESQQSTDPVADEKARKLAMLVKYIVHGLARYDAHWDVRDRARLVWGLVRGLVDKYSATSEEEENEVGGVVLRREQVRVVLFEGKAGGLVDDHERGREVKGTFGALSAFGIGAASASEPSKRHQNYDELEDEDDRVKADETLVLDSFDEDVPEWMEKGVESKLRDSENDNAAIRKPVITAMGSGNFNRGEQASGGVSGAGARAASSAGPVVLVPTNLAGTSEAVASEPKKAWGDLDSFYADTEVVEEVEDSDEDEDSEEDEDDGSDNDGEEVSPERGEARRTADGSEENHMMSDGRL